MNNSRRQLTAQDLYRIALAEYYVQHPKEGYPDSWWDLLEGGTEERFNQLPQAAQTDIEKRMSDFVPSISELFDELDDFDDDQDTDDEFDELDDDYSYDEDPDEQQEREEDRQRIIQAIHDSVIDEFDDFLAED